MREALIAHERLCMEDLRAAFGAEDASRAIEPVTSRILESRSCILALYDRQREEAERLSADRLTAEEAQAIVAVAYYETGNDGYRRVWRNLLVKLRRLSHSEPRRMNAKSRCLHVMTSVYGGWAVRREGSVRALRTFKTKLEALSYAKTLSDMEELVVHRTDGTVEYIRDV